MSTTHQIDTALFVAAFFDELTRWGVRDVVVSPGSRSTALAMAAFELSCRRPDELRLFVDIDERGASFLALGMAKASGRPVALVCTSGTALANYYPAVIEAETSRVPLLVLSGDRPPHMQGLGAPQTTDQLKAYGDHVRAFRAMPLPGGTDRDIAFARQAAREACLAAFGPGATLAGGVPIEPFATTGNAEADRYLAGLGDGDEADGDVQVASRGAARAAGPVHVNFPFDAPLKPDFEGADEQAIERGAFDCFEMGAPSMGTVLPRADKAGKAAKARGQLGADAGAKVERTNGNGLVGTDASSIAAATASAAATAVLPLIPGSHGPLTGARVQALREATNAAMAQSVPAVQADLGTLEASADQAVQNTAAAPDDRSVRAGAEAGAAIRSGLGPLLGPTGQLPGTAVAALEEAWFKRPTLVLVGEGSCSTLAEAEEIVAWARRWSFPLLADPLSGLRSVDDSLVIDNYDNLCRHESCPAPEVVIRFGRYPVSQSTAAFLEKARPLSIVVDVAETRDFNLATDVFVGTTPLGFVRSPWQGGDRKAQRAFARAWTEANDEARERIVDVVPATADHPVEGAFVRTLLELIPKGSCLFSANSMPIRALDTFYVRDAKPIAVMANRGQNGIDGVVSTALGAAQHFDQTTFLTGDFTMLHDLNALALQREIMKEHRPKVGRHGAEGLTAKVPSIIIVLLNNNGGAIFDMLPQASDDPYFERLFLAPQDVDFQAAADAFMVPSIRVSTLSAFREAYAGLLGNPGINLIEVQLPLRGVTDRYAPYQA